MAGIHVRDEAGMTTAGMVLAMLVTLSLVFSTAQVYRVQSLSARTQSVADASALAAQNVVAEFMIAARVCDAVVLSLSLATGACAGLGVVALCVPGAQAIGGELLSAAGRVAEARDSFSQRAAAGLNRVQKALPFLSASAAVAVAHANAHGASSYVALAVSVPAKTPDIAVPDDAGAGRRALDSASEQADAIREAAQEADQAAQEANEAKQRAFEHDCGARPEYCMAQRAESLAGLSGADNPLYSSVDAWSFSVALERARSYYAARLNSEKPRGVSVEEQVRSEMRRRMYAFACEELSWGYVYEDGGSFEAYFPSLPCNTEQMKGTSLYTDRVYPCTRDEDGRIVMHAWPGCPRVNEIAWVGSIAEMEGASYAECNECHFSASSLGEVAQASSVIENGFEYHYAIVADAARDYEEALERAHPASQEVRDRASSVFDEVVGALKAAGGMRIEAHPPGSKGVVVLVSSIGEDAPAAGFESTFVQAAGALGTRVAVSAATLVADPSGEGPDVLTSMLDGLKPAGGALIGAAGMVLECWSGLLGAYAQGQDSLRETVRSVLGGLPLVGASGLGDWAADAFESAIEAVGLEPANLDALRPVLVNSAHVAASDGDQAACARLLELKRMAVEHPLASNDAFTAIVGATERSLFASLDDLGDAIEVATVDIEGTEVPVTVALPPCAKEFSKGAIERVADMLLAVRSSVAGVRPWD